MMQSFFLEAGQLVREVTPGRGMPYRHRCPLAALEQVARAIDDLGGEPFSTQELIARTGLPDSQVAVVTAFLRDQGITLPDRGRKCRRSGAEVHTAALAAIETLPGSVAPRGPATQTEFSYPLWPGVVVTLKNLPPDLTLGDVARLEAFLKTLVLGPPESEAAPQRDQPDPRL